MKNQKVPIVENERIESGKTTQNKRNGIISLWKFIFAIIIVFFHGQFLYADRMDSVFFKVGYIGVEFFFIVSGYYFAKSALKKEYNETSKGKDTIIFVWNRIKKLIPYMILSFILSFAVLVVRKYEADELINSIWNLFALRVFGFNSAKILSPFWYIGVLVFVMFVTYPSLVKHKENYILRAAPIIILLSYGVISHKYNKIDLSYGHWFYITNISIFRGFAAMNIGMIVCYITNLLKKVEYTKLFRWIITILGEALLITVVIGAQYSIPGQYDMIYVLLITISVLIISSTKTYDYRFLSNKVTNYLERLSMPIFINQMSFVHFCQLLSHKITVSEYQLSLIAVALTIICSAIEMYIIDYLKTKELNKKIRQIIVKPVN